MEKLIDEEILWYGHRKVAERVLQIRVNDVVPIAVQVGKSCKNSLVDGKVEIVFGKGVHDLVLELGPCGVDCQAKGPENGGLE